MGVHTSPATGPASAKKSRPGYVLRYVVAPIVLVLLGISIMLAPVISTQWHNFEQHKIAREYSERILKTEATELHYQWGSAEQWNASISMTPLGDPWTSQADHADPNYRAYLQELNINPVMARIRVPSANIDLPVYHGTDEHTLAHGVGHLYGTDLPIGGTGTHAVLTGHTGIATATLFDNLSNISHGEHMAVEVLGETLTYRVTDIQTVLPHETESLRAVADQDLLTLITCTPYGVNTHRLLVTGERIPNAPPHTEAVSPAVQPWMLLALGLAALIILITITVLLLRRKEVQK